MIDQTQFDILADNIVSEGRLVSYASLQLAHRDEYRNAISDRDLKGLYGNWRARRRYKGHLAVLDLPEEMEKAIASFAAITMKIAEARAQAAIPITRELGTTAGFLEQMQRIVTGLERQLAALADENNALRDQIAALQPPAVIPVVEERQMPARVIVENRPRKTGAAKLAATVFWDKVIKDLSNRIFAGSNPMSAKEMLPEVPEVEKVFAEKALQKLDEQLLIHKLKQRIDGKKYGLFRLDDGRFGVFPMSPDARPAMDAVAAA
jgi:hypothetical protein